MSTTGGNYRGNPRTAPPSRGATPSFPPTPSGSGIPVPAPSPGGPSHSEAGSSVSDSRKRQGKRDEAIRRKIENDLNKKKHTVSRARQTRKVAPGTVIALRPSQALQIKPNTTVAEAAQIMAAKREDCVLVTDDEDRISGIFTAKDLAFRVVGAGIDARDVTIAQIMTKNPLCARTDTSATDALDLMVRKGFRHLPVMDENQDISGILDITKCFYEAMEKLERAYASSRKLYDALKGVQSELGSSQQIIHYVEALRQKMSGPDLQSVLDGNPPTVVSVRTTVKDAAAMMKENHTTAVLVQDNGSITGIFTSKDVVLRVIAAGLDPANCSVIRVMTPHPDFAPMDMSIQAALRKMHDGHYLNLPVMNEAAEIVGMVDVLKLTYATLEQINSMGTTDSEGPAWNKFWMSLDNDTESAVSNGTRHTGPPIRPHQPDSPVRGSRHASGMSTDRHDSSAILPTDSASHHGDSQFGGGSQLNVRAVKLIKKDLLAKEARSKEVLANSMSSIISNPESIATTVAQVSAIKKRIRKSEIMGIANRQEDGKVRDMTPGYAVSETVVNNLAQMKHLKGAKKLLVQQRQSDPTPLPLALRRQGRSGDSDDLLLANQEYGSVSAPVSEGDQDESDGDSSDDPGYRAFSELRREQDKENKKRVTPAPLHSLHRRKRQKRFTDPQEGAMRTSPIDEEGIIISTPPVRPDKRKGRRMGRISDEGEEEEGGRGWEGHGDEGGEDEDEDEDGSEFVPDEREVSDDKVNRSRRHLPSSFKHGSMHSSDPANSPQRGAVVVYNHPSAGNSPARRGSGSNVAVVSTNPSQRSQRSLSEEVEGSRAGPLDRRFDEDGHINLQEVARINRLAKINRAAVHTQRKPTTFWTEEGTKALIHAIHEYGPSWAVIRDLAIPSLEGRDNVQLKDKARNIKVDMIKAKIALPLCFRRVSIKKADMEILAKMGIYPDEDGNYPEDPDRCSEHTFDV